MADFNIRRGLSTELFINGETNPNIVLEAGCLYLCTDTAELFLGSLDSNERLVLKQINRADSTTGSPNTPSIGESEDDKHISGAYINAAGELCLIFSDNTEESLGKVVGTDGKDGVTAPIKIGDTVYEPVNGMIELPSFTTKDYVDEKFSNINIPETDLTNFATKEFVTQEITKDISGLVTKVELQETINAIEHPQVDLSSCATVKSVSELETRLANEITTKANNVPFTSAKFITKPFGNFTYGENISGLSVTEIFAKLLGLVNDDPNEEEPTSLIDKIINDEIPMYSITNEGALVESPFKLIDGNTAPTESGFYTITDDQGNIIEAGYQDISIKNDEMYYVIAIPKEIDYNTMVELKTWDPDESVWVNSELALVSDSKTINSICDEAGIDISHIDTDRYTVWALEDICTGSIIRYSIKEA